MSVKRASGSMFFLFFKEYCFRVRVRVIKGYGYLGLGLGLVSTLTLNDPNP